MSLQRGDLIFKRSIHLQEILMATNHLGYVSFINNNFDKNIKIILQNYQILIFQILFWLTLIY